jgi:hypothetical protein
LEAVFGAPAAADPLEAVFGKVLPEQMGPLSRPPTPEVPEVPGKAALAEELGAAAPTSLVGGALKEAATTVGGAVKPVANVLTLAPRIAEPELGALPKEAIGALGRFAPGAALRAKRALEAAEPVLERPLAQPVAEALTAGHPMGTGWPGALYEAGVETALGLTSPKGLAMLAGLGFAPADAQVLAGSYFSGTMASQAKAKFEEAWKLFEQGDAFAARKALMASGLTAGMAAMPLLHGRAETPKTAVDVVAQPAQLAEAMAKEPPLAPPEVKAAAKVAIEGNPSADELSAMRLAEIAKGHITPEDVPPRLEGAIAVRRNLLGFAESMQSFIDNGQRVGRYRYNTEGNAYDPYAKEWYGIKSMLPKSLQQKWEYQDIVDLIQKGLAGGEMTAREKAYFGKIYDWQQKRDGPLSMLDLEIWANQNGLNFKTPSVLQELDTEQERAAIKGEQITGGAIEFDPTKLEAMKPTGASKLNLERTPSGEMVAPLMPPEPALRSEANRLVRSIAGGDDQRTADALAEIYGVRTPVEVQRTQDVRVPETSWAEPPEPGAGRNATGRILIRLPPDAEPYQLAHEVMYEARRMTGHDATLPEHDDNIITARVVGDLKEAGLSPAGAPAPVVPQVHPYAPDAAIAEVRDADNADVMRRATDLHMEVPLVTPFVEQTVAPVVKATGGALTEAAKAMVGAVAPRVLADDRAIDSIMRRAGAITQQQASLALNAEYAKFQTMLPALGKAELIELIDAIKDGRVAELGPKTLPGLFSDVRDAAKGRQTTLDLQRYAELRRRIDTEQYKETDALLKAMGKSGVPWRDNHLRIFWKVRPDPQRLMDEMAKMGASGVARRPLEGTGGFLRQQVYENLSAGLKAGGEPWSYNPAVLDDLAWTDMAKLRGAMTMLGELKAGGFAKFVKLYDPAPDGWKVLDDKIAKVYFPAESGEGMIHAGNYYFDPAVHRLLSNYLSADVIRQSGLGRGLLFWKNFTTATELAYSTFHAVVESVEAMGTAGGLALERFAKAPFVKKPQALVQGIADWATAPLRYARAGEQFRQYLASPEDFLKTPGGQRMLSKFGNQQAIQDAVDAAFTGGLKITAGQDYRINTAKTFMESLRNAYENPASADYIGVMLRAFPFVNETVMRPLFNEYIPRLKLGAFLEEYGMGLDRFADELAKGEISKATIARRAVDRIEDRFGEMNFDNLFWNRNFKTALQYLFRSVTWKIGNIRAVGRGLFGQAGELLEPLDYVRQKMLGKEVTARPLPRLDPDFAWMVSVTATTATLGTIVQKLMGQPFPWQTSTPFMDAFMPRSGGFSEDGKPNRLLLPSYVRDWLSAKHDPQAYVMHGLSSTVGRSLEAWNNRDFYGNEVYDDRNPYAQRLLQGIAHVLTPSWPFSFQGAGKAAERGFSPVAPFAGMQPAPRAYQETPFEQFVSGQLSRKYETAARRPEDVTTHDLAKEIRDRAALGLPPTADIGRQRLAQIYRSATGPMFERRAAVLGLEDLLNGWHLASDEEKAKLMPILRKKATNRAIANIPATDDRRINVINRIRAIFGGAPVVPPSVQLGGA